MSTGQEPMAVLCGREGNRRSGVAPVMRHRLRGTYIRLRDKWPKVGKYAHRLQT